MRDQLSEIVTNFYKIAFFYYIHKQYYGLWMRLSANKLVSV